MEKFEKINTICKIIKEDAPKLNKFFKELPKLSHTYVDYNYLVHSIFKEDPDLEETILYEVKEGTFNKRSEGGFQLYNQLALNISNKIIRKENNIHNRRFKKGYNINKYLKNSFKTNVNEYLKKYSK